MSMYSQGRSMPAKHRLAARPWQDQTFERVVCERRSGWQRESRRKGTLAKTAFLCHLKETFGNEVRAWRRGLDLEGTFAVSLTALRRYCSTANLKIDVKALWQKMDKDWDGVMELEEVCPKLADALASFQRWSSDRFGSCAALWDCPAMVRARWKPQSGGMWVSDKKMLLERVNETLQTLECPCDADDRSKVLASLDLYGCDFISRSDLEWLDSWQPPQWLRAQADPRAWEKLREMLLREYFHPLRAWRNLLDRDDSNHISWYEFRRACKQLGFKGNIGGAWRVLDIDRSGTITMDEYDLESAVILRSFKTWAEKNFGCLELMFKALDSDESGSISYSELKLACQRLKWEGSVCTLFDCINGSWAGKRVILKDDLTFLDSWQPDPSKQEREDEEQMIVKKASQTAPVGFRNTSNSLPSPQMPRGSVTPLVLAGARRGSAPQALTGSEASLQDLPGSDQSSKIGSRKSSKSSLACDPLPACVEGGNAAAQLLPPLSATTPLVSELPAVTKRPLSRSSSESTLSGICTRDSSRAQELAKIRQCAAPSLLAQPPLRKREPIWLDFSLYTGGAKAVPREVRPRRHSGSCGTSRRLHKLACPNSILLVQ